MKELSAAKALEPLRSGQRVLVGSGAAAAQELVAALAGAKLLRRCFSGVRERAAAEGARRSWVRLADRLKCPG